MGKEIKARTQSWVVSCTGQYDEPHARSQDRERLPAPRFVVARGGGCKPVGVPRSELFLTEGPAN